MIKNIIGCYRRHLAGRAALEVLTGKLNDDEAQECIRGIGAQDFDIDKWAQYDINNWFAAHDQKLKKLQIKVECDYNYNSYLIYLNFI